VATFLDLYKSFDGDSGKRGKQFESFVKWFLMNEPEWASQVDQVWLWDEYPGRWGADCGIDLVFRHKNGEMWAVQAKCYSPQYSITKHDVDKFLSESNRNGISKRLLIASTDGIGANAKQVCDAQEKLVVRYLLSNFESAKVEYPSKIENLKSLKRKDPPLPRPHQLEAIEAVNNNFKNIDRGQLIMACGTGKTFTTLWIKEALASKSTLVLLPSLSLLSQTLKEWTFATKEQFSVLCVCSDQTVGKRGEDEIIHSVSDLAFPVTSNVEDIKQFIYGNGNKVVFSTYQSSPLVADAFLDNCLPSFDLIVADEAHRCTGKVSSDFSTVLDGDRIRSKKRLFTTATPRTYTASVKKAAAERGADVVGMDDEAIFGKVLFSLTFGEAIKKELLTDFRVIIVGVDDPMISSWIDSRELVETETGIESDAASLAAQIGLLKAIKDYDLKRVISFHSRVSRAESFSKEIHKVCQWVDINQRPSGELWSDYVSGDMPADKRRIKLDQLKSLKADQRGILTNARCLSEGVDVPSLDGVAFIDPRGSQVDIIQAVGRAIRLSKDKKFGTIVLPVFIAKGEDGASSIEASNFKPIWDVLNALKSHDEELSQALDAFRISLGNKTNSRSISCLTKIEIDLPVSISKDFGVSISTHLVERTTSSWFFWYGLLESYSLEFGHSRVPGTYKTLNKLTLGDWVSHQRMIRATLSKDKLDLLERLPKWSWDAFADKWNDGYDALLNFVKNNGHAKVPKTFVAQGFKLGLWVMRQRQQKEALSQDKLTLLEELSGWTWDPLGDQWELGFEQIKKYTSLNGSSLVPYDFMQNGFKLGSWVSNKRASRETLSEEQIKLLENLPKWSWDISESIWDECYSELLKYVEHNNTFPLKSYKTASGFSLGSWIYTQRKNKLDLPKIKIDRLETIKGWSWDVFGDKWSINYSILKNYSDVHKSSLVPLRHIEDGVKIGVWVATQRANKNILDKSKANLLEALPEWAWNLNEYNWTKNLYLLDKYSEIHGTSRIPQGVIFEGVALGSLVSTLRKSKSALSAEKIVQLEILPNWTWDPIESNWQEALVRLKDFRLQNGHVNVLQRYRAQDGFSLGQWVAKQKKDKAILPIEKKLQLESIDGWIW
jgi:superfamily II DNA or RNA helicase